MDLASKPFNLDQKEIEHVYEIFNKLNTKQKVGQLFCVLGDSFEFVELKNLIKKYGLGGVLWRPDKLDVINEKNEQLDALTKIPLLKAANLEEGGNGAYLEGLRYGNELQIASTQDKEEAFRFGKVVANEAKKAGVHVTFSPVCDIDYNYQNPITNERTFGSNPKIVKDLAVETVCAIQEENIAACAKHFPGDGVDFRDQHLHPTYNSLTSKEWYKTYGSIYKSLIDKGLASIMCGHIIQYNVEHDLNPNLQFKDALPGSLSKELLQGVLRNKFNFNGLIFTDATIMGGFTMSMPREVALPYCIEAGIDMIVFNTNLEEDINYILKGLKTGILSQERLDEAVLRILAFKIRFCKKQKNDENLDIKNWCNQLANKSITLVKSNNTLPINKKKFNEIELIVLGKSKTNNFAYVDYFKDQLSKRGFKVSLFDIDKVDLHGPKNINKKKLVIALANYETESNQTVVRLKWADKHCLDMPRFIFEENYILISLANPYHLVDCPRVQTYINCYVCNEFVINNLIEKLFGESPFIGNNPVDPFCGMEDTKL